MKIAVILNKYGKQLNIQLPNNWNESNIFDNVISRDVSEEFIEYFEKVTDKIVNSKFYFDKVLYVDTIDLENYLPHYYDDYDDLTDYPYLGIGRKPNNNRIPTETQLEKIIEG